MDLVDLFPLLIAIPLAMLFGGVIAILLGTVLLAAVAAICVVLVAFVFKCLQMAFVSKASPGEGGGQ